MAFKKLLNLPTPSDPYEAVRKIYVDDSIFKVEEKINDSIIKVEEIIRVLKV